MKILSRYLLTQHAMPFVFALSALTSIMLLNQIARRLGDLLGKGLPWTVIVEFFALTIPFIVVMTVSMAVLVAVLYTMSRMAGDHEVTALRAGGISLGEIIRPLLGAATAVAVAAFLFGDQVLPRSNHKLRSLMTDIYRTKPTFSLKEHVINEVRDGRLMLRAASIDQATYRMRDVTVYDVANPNHQRIIYADSGRIAFAPGGEDLHLTLYDGETHEYDRQDPQVFQRTSFGTQIVLAHDVGREFVRRENDDYRGDREMGVCQLEEVVLNARQEAWRAEQRARAAQRNGLRALVGRAAREPDLSDPPGGPSLYCRALTRIAAWLGPQELQAQEPRRQAQDSARGRADGRFERTLGPSLVSRALPRTQLSEVKLLRERERSARIREAVYLVEFHKKYAVPAACIVFVLIGVPVALRFPRGGVGLVVGVSFAIFAVYYIGLIAGESLANRMIVTPFLAMWAPNLIMSVLGGIGLWRIRRQGCARRTGRRERGSPARTIPREVPA